MISPRACLVGRCLFLLALLAPALAAQEPAQIKRIVVSLVARPVDKEHPLIFSDSSYQATCTVFGTDTGDPGGYVDRALDLKPASRFEREVLVYYRANKQPVHLVIVSGEAVESGVSRRRYGVGLGASPEEAESGARAHLARRLPAWPGGNPRVVTREIYPAGQELTSSNKYMRRAVVHIAWRYVPEVSPSAQTELGFALSLNTDAPVSSDRMQWMINFFPELDGPQLRERGIL